MQKKPTQCSIIVYLCLLFNFVVIRTLHSERVADQKTELETLKFVHVLWRHGVRTPAIEMAKEPREWKQGLGELTTKGMGQLFRLGQWIRRRYDGGFLSPEYNNYELYVRSSDFNRTLMSAQALLAGLYPPRTNKTFTPDLNWQPFPVHTEPREIDRVIFDGTNCDAMVAEEQSVFNSAEVKAIERSNIEFLSFLAAQSGFERMPLPLREMRYVFDPITCIHLNGEGKELPKWANASVIDRIWQLNDISSAYLYNTTKMARFRAGVLFTEILERMKSIQNGFGAKYDSRQRMHAYSAHDTTLAGVLAAFGIRPSPFPRFATALFIELHRMPSAHPPGHSVRLFYRNETDSGTLWEWPIPDCPSPCTLDQLEHARASILTTAEEQNKECGGVRSTKFVWTADDQLASRHREHIYIALVCALSLLCSALFLYIVCRSLMSSHRRKKRDWKWRKMKCAPGSIASTATTMLLLDELGQSTGNDDSDDDEFGDGRGRKQREAEAIMKMTDYNRSLTKKIAF